MDREESEKHWEYTEKILLMMIEMCKVLYIEAMIHGAKHEEAKRE